MAPLTPYPEERWPAELRALPTAEHPDGRRLVPTLAVQALFRCGASNLREMRRQGKLAATVYRDGNVHYFDREDVAAAYLDKYPLRLAPPASDGLADAPDDLGDEDDARLGAEVDALPFLQRRAERATGASDGPPEVPQSGRQELVSQMETTLAGMVEARVGPLAQQLAEARQEGARRAETIDAQARALDAQAQTIGAQRAEIERLTRRAEAAEEERRRGWWARLWSKRS